jgi:dihydrofolate synthase/folylpolyglutamate synthase
MRGTVETRRIFPHTAIEIDMQSPELFTGSASVFDWISRFITAGPGKFSKSFRLDRMEILAELAGRPERSAPVIHVAGSKGKGSVTGMISAMLTAGGLKTARYTSPHVTGFRERITQGNDFFDESVYAAAGNTLREIVEIVSDRSKKEYAIFNPASPEGCVPTFFELLTLYFFLCSKAAGCLVMAVETGLGGRLDATNIVDPLVSVITSIEMEHAEYLGNTLPLVAGEKAGIIKQGRPLVLMEQEREIFSVFEKAAELKNAPLIYSPAVARLEDIRIRRTGTDFTLRLDGSRFFPGPLRLSIAIPGEIQAKNAALSVIAAKTAFPALGAGSVREGLRNFRLPARFERIMKNPPVIIDGAHTPHSIEFCTATFTALYGEGGILVFGCAAEKDALTMARLLIPHFSRIIVTTPGTFKKSFPETVYEIFKSLPDAGGEILLIDEPVRALERALKLGRETGLPILGTGSFYLAAEIRNSLAGEDARSRRE